MADPEVKAPSAGDVKVPVLGNVSKKGLMVAGVVAGGVLAYAYYRHAKNASSSTTGTATGTSGGLVTDPAGNTCAALDPNSGYCPGTAQDLAYQQENEGDINSDDGEDTSDIDPETGYEYGTPADTAALAALDGTGTTTTTGTTTATATTNADWEQECITNLESGGVDSTTIANAESGLPRYLAKLSLTSAQATAVQLAVGLTGEPPVGGPFAIITAPPTSTGTGTGSTATTVKVPNVVGMDVDDAVAALQKAGLKDVLTLVRKPGHTYIVTSQAPTAGSTAPVGGSITINAKEKS
jgi:hypothetical protein